MRHVPVLLNEIIEGLNVNHDKRASRDQFVFVDCNLGDGGHSEAVLEQTKGNVTIIGIDLDEEALDRAKENLDLATEKLYAANSLECKPTIHYVKTNFRHLENAVTGLGHHGCQLSGNIDAILFDLGLSSYEIEESGRGFSFKSEEPLAMTFGDKNDRDEYKFTAEDIVNKWDVEHIEIIIRSYGEDRFAGRIARRIVESRLAKMEATGHGIETAKELADIVKSAYPAMFRFGRIHPATKTFQALRITVNDELESLQQALPSAVKLLKKGGRLAVISYHGLEDRIVKRFFRELADGEGHESGENGERGDKKQIKLLNKKPLTPEDAELERNPRSRSAKLRIIEKL